MKKPQDFGRMTYETFQKMARDNSLSVYEKVGFPDSYRKNKEHFIFKDILYKTNLNRRNIKILDLGCGCSDLAHHFIAHSAKHKQKLVLVDSQEMLDLIKNPKTAKKLALRFPDSDFVAEHTDFFDVIVVYSVMQHIILDMNPFTFIDKALEILKPGGRLLIGDLPNISMRNRFFASDSGVLFHQKFMKTKKRPQVQFNKLQSEKIDDSLILAILQRYRMAGMQAYVLPQPSELPMSNRREDILICKM